MNSNSSFSKQDSVLAQSLDISTDIYKFPLSNKSSKEDQDKSKSSKQNDSMDYDKEDSLSNIMNSKDVVSCPCCNNEKTKVLSQNPIFVEKREGSDPVFLDENEVQPIEESEHLRPVEKEQQEDIVSSQIIELIKQDSFDPSSFSF